MTRAILSFLFCIVIFFHSCLLQEPIVQTDLYFGMSKTSGDMISDSAWNIFLHNEVSKVFSEGFTVIHSEGMWVEQQKRKINSEPSRIISSVNVMTPSMSEHIDSLREKYKTLFQQQSVLRVDKKLRLTFNTLQLKRIIVNTYRRKILATNVPKGSAPTLTWII